MKTDDEILINQYGQGLVIIEHLVERFSMMDLHSKREYLESLSHLIMQSKAKNSDVETAIVLSGLKMTYTPCVILRKGVASENLQRISDLPENELLKALVLLLSLFKIAYVRRFETERDDPHKWWYWDLSDKGIVDTIRKQNI